MKADAYELITHIDGFEKDRPYYISLLDAAHEQAFEDNYHISYGKRNRSTFDPNTYIEEVFTLMSQKATADGSTHIATNLDTYYHETILGEDPPARPKTPPPRK
jgi:hypothetical protein